MESTHSRISPEALGNLFHTAADMLLLDTRSATSYATQHIAGAISVSLPKLLLKRIQKQPIDSLQLEDLVVGDKDELARRKTGCAVVVYDENGILDDVSTSTVMAVLAAEGVHPLYLQGL